MKGNALIVIIMMLAITVALFIAYSPSINLFGGGEGSIHKTSLHSRVFTMDYALEAAKLYMQTALDYSVYQACFDNLARGGREEIDKENGQSISGSEYAFLPESFSKDEFLRELEASVKTNLNIYRSKGYTFLSEYYVYIPDYTDVRIETIDPSKLSVSASSKNKISTSSQTESGESITLTASPETSTDISIPCLTIFQKGKELNTAIKLDFEQALSDIVGGLDEGACQDKETCIQAIGQALEGNPAVKFGPKKVDDHLISGEFLKISLPSFVFDRLTGKSTFKVEAIQKITISEEEPPPEHFFPVWNGNEIAFEDLELVFINKKAFDVIPGQEPKPSEPEPQPEEPPPEPPTEPPAEPTMPVTEFDSIINQASVIYGVEVALIKAIIKVESDFYPNAVSGKGAQGLMQLMPTTAEGLEECLERECTPDDPPEAIHCKNKEMPRISDNLLDPEKNINGGTCLISFLSDRYDNLDLVIAAYNAGYPTVDDHGVPDFPETQNFVTNVKDYYNEYKSA